MKKIDTHLHFWDLANNMNSWVMHQDESPELKQNYLPQDLFKNQSISGVVHIEAHDSAIPTIREIEWLNQLMQNYPEVKYAHIAFADITLPADEFAIIIDQIKPFSCVKGVRHILSHHEHYKYSPCDSDLSGHANILANLKYLAANNLIFDCQMYPYQLIKFLPAIIEAKVACVVDHFALPKWDNQDDFAVWKQAIIALAKCSQVYLKLSGLNMFKERAEYSEVLDFCLQHIPGERLVYGTNYPVSCNDDYNAWYNYLNDILKDPALKENIFFNNAAKLFNM